MNIHSIAGSARLYARSEAMVAEILLRVYARKFVFASLALLALAMGLVFLNLAAYSYLQSIWGPVWTPLAISLANFGLAALALLVAVFAHPGPELSLAKDLRNNAGQALEDEFQSQSALTGITGAQGDAGLARLLLPIVISIVGSLSRRKAAAKK